MSALIYYCWFSQTFLFAHLKVVTPIMKFKQCVTSF